ncbi:MAG: hypothetical protein AAGF15_04660 [Pseudomonadota bacterium]
MAQNHLNDFLNDIKVINPDFTRSRSSLKRLIEHLEKTVAAPQQMTANEAIGRCTNFRSSRLDKYKPAIDRLVSVWGKGGIRPYPKGTYGGTLVEVNINRLCFRGDDRPPSQIFGPGFQKRALGTKVKYKGFKDVGGRGQVVGPMAGITRPGDIDSKTAVCVTPDMNIAALFPLPATGEIAAKETWLYMVYISSGYNTHGRQVLDAIKGLAALEDLENAGTTQAERADIYDQRAKDVMKLIYGRELAADAIPPTQIIGAFKIRRGWAKKKRGAVIRTDKVGEKLVNVYGPPSADFTGGGRYQLLEWQANEGADLPDASYQRVIDEFIAALKPGDPSGGTHPMPTPADGFVPSFRKKAVA